MPNTMITPKFINRPKPGKKMWSLKLEDESFFLIPALLAPQFKVGGSYEIEYEESDYNGTIYRTVKSVKQKQEAPATGGSAALSRKTDPVDSDNMWTCAVMVAAIKSGLVTMDESSLVQTEILIRTAHRRASANQPPKPREDMGDDIPF